MLASALDLCYLSIADTRDLFRRRELSPVELTLAHLSRIESLQPSIRAYITVMADQALADARTAEAALLRGDERPLLGIPLAYKDLYLTAGVHTPPAARCSNTGFRRAPRPPCRSCRTPAR